MLYRYGPRWHHSDEAGIAHAARHRTGDASVIDDRAQGWATYVNKSPITTPHSKKKEKKKKIYIYIYAHTHISIDISIYIYNYMCIWHVFFASGFELL